MVESARFVSQIVGWESEAVAGDEPINNSGGEQKNVCARFSKFDNKKETFPSEQRPHVKHRKKAT